MGDESRDSHPYIHNVMNPSSTTDRFTMSGTTSSNIQSGAGR